MSNSLLSPIFIPTLRIIMTNKCNGECFFCHKEGNFQCHKDISQMNLDTIHKEIIPAIKTIGIKKVIFTGGEPTMHKDIALAINMVKSECKDILVGITTNGYDIDNLIPAKDNLDRLTMSVSSLKNSIYMHYTKINPCELVNDLHAFNKTKKSVSIVVTDENHTELNDLIEYFVSNEFDIKLQFIIPNKEKGDTSWNRKILYYLMEMYGKFDIELGATPILYKKIGNSKLKIKLASLNIWMYDNIFIRRSCLHCEKKLECVERGCAVRIYPNGTVTSCLNNFNIFSSNNIRQNIVDAYQSLEIIENLCNSNLT